MKIPEKAQKEARSIESLKDKRDLRHMGSVEKSGTIYDYYQDPDGRWYYENRYRRPDGNIVSLETAVFGREISKGQNRRKSCYARS